MAECPESSQAESVSQTRIRGRTIVRRTACILFLAALAGAAFAASAAGSGSAKATPPVALGSGVIVRARAGRTAAAEALVRRLGGTVHEQLALIDGFSASVPAKVLGAVRSSAAVLSLTHNRLLVPQSASYTDDYDPNSDGYSMANITELTGARSWWAAGYTGQGVGVALIDSGIAPVLGLSSPGQVANGPDLSLESQAPNLRYLDTYGHGTFMAGLIAGRDATPNPNAPASTYLGMAPGARIVSLKVGDADGGTDVTQVIAAIDWVVQHRSDNGLNIRVINLSYGTNSLQDYQSDPLAYAAEQAWKHGLVVVAAGGNDGFQTKKSVPALADPAVDPYIVAVGSADTIGTRSLADDQVPSFSPWPKKGSTRSVDLVAPGVHMQGLRVPNSYIDSTHPEGFLSDRYFRGSGTSESTAVISGAAALLLQRFPDATPDQIKKLLMDGAVRIQGKSRAIGAGELQLGSLLEAALPNWAQTWAPSTGQGSIEGSRGSDHLTRDGVVLSGEQDIFGAPISTPSLASAEAAGSSWSGGTWNGNSWSGSSWSGSSWSGSSWSGNAWSGSSWSTSSWSGNSWSGSSWSGSSWSGSSWSGSSWSGGSWAGAFWG
jgi:serine protease AprX